MKTYYIITHFSPRTAEGRSLQRFDFIKYDIEENAIKTAQAAKEKHPDRIFSVWHVTETQSVIWEC